MSKSTLTLLFILGSISLSAQDSLQLILSQKHSPSKQKIHINITDNNGDHSTIPIAIIKGRQGGPVFTIISGVHGFEYPPIIATQQLIQEIQPEHLVGTLIIIPLLNPNSFYSRTPFLNPQDLLNLNRVFPGNEDGTITERIAAYITESVIAKSDVIVDIHGGDANEDLLPFVCYYNHEEQQSQTQRAKTLSEASGMEYIVSYPYRLKDHQPAKYLFKQAIQDGKVGLSIECGRLGNLQKEAVAKIKNAVYNMLSEMEMYIEKNKKKNDFTHLNSQTYIKSKHQGIFESNYVAGDQVQKGNVIGHIKNEFGDIITKITSNQTGIILYKIGTPPVNINETLVCIGSTK